MPVGATTCSAGDVRKAVIVGFVAVKILDRVLYVTLRVRTGILGSMKSRLE